MTQDLRTEDEFRAALYSGRGVIVIVDRPTGKVAHPVACPTLDISHFRKKVIENAQANGAYYWAESLDEARRDLGARPCQCL